MMLARNSSCFQISSFRQILFRGRVNVLNRLSINPHGLKRLKVDEEIVIVVNRVHSFMNELNLTQEVRAVGRMYLSLEIIIYVGDIFSQDDIEVNNEQIFIDKVAPKDIDNMLKRRSSLYDVEHLKDQYFQLFLTFRLSLQIKLASFLQKQSIGVHIFLPHYYIEILLCVK